MDGFKRKNSLNHKSNTSRTERKIFARVGSNNRLGTVTERSKTGFVASRNDPIVKNTKNTITQNAELVKNLREDELQKNLKVKKNFKKAKIASRFNLFKHDNKSIRLTTRAIFSVFIAVVIGGVGMFGYRFYKAKNIFNGTSEGAPALGKIELAKLKGEGDGRVNFLILGKGGGDHEAPDLTDTLLVASIDPITNEASILSIPRDLWVSNGYGASKINSIYASSKEQALYKNPKDSNAADKAGIDAIKNKISTIIGIPLHYYVMVDFTAFKKAIDTVGGIDIDVKEDLVDYNVAWENGNSPVIAKKGPNHMDGKKALLYARSRYGSARGDFDRSERQKEVMIALKNKVLASNVYSNPSKALGLLDAFSDNMETDIDLGKELASIYELAKKINSSSIVSLSLVDEAKPILQTANVNGQSVVVPIAGTFDYSELQSYVRNNIKDALLKKENARVIVLNGTSTEGLATKKSVELKSYGYNVVKVDSAQKLDYQKTQIIDLTGGKMPYTVNYLNKRINKSETSATNPEPLITATDADVVIILGIDG